MVAAFFALCELPEQDATIYALRCERILHVKKDELRDFSGIALYEPPLIADRIFQQQSIFAVIAPPFRDLRHNLPAANRLARLIIPADCREDIFRKLINIGIDRSYLFPDLDGAAAHINWMLENPFLVADAQPGYHQEMGKLGDSTQKAVNESMRSIDQSITEIEQQVSQLDLTSAEPS